MNITRTLMTRTIPQSTRPLAAPQTRSFSSRNNGSRPLIRRQKMLNDICNELILTEDELGEIENVRDMQQRKLVLRRKNNLIDLFHHYCDEITFLKNKYPSDFPEER